MNFSNSAKMKLATMVCMSLAQRSLKARKAVMLCPDRCCCYCVNGCAGSGNSGCCRSGNCGHDCCESYQEDPLGALTGDPDDCCRVCGN